MHVESDIDRPVSDVVARFACGMAIVIAIVLEGEGEEKVNDVFEKEMVSVANDGEVGFGFSISTGICVCGGVCFVGRCHHRHDASLTGV